MDATNIDLAEVDSACVGIIAVLLFVRTLAIVGIAVVDGAIVPIVTTYRLKDAETALRFYNPPAAWLSAAVGTIVNACTSEWIAPVRCVWIEVVAGFVHTEAFRYYGVAQFLCARVFARIAGRVQHAFAGCRACPNQRLRRTAGRTSDRHALTLSRLEGTEVHRARVAVVTLEGGVGAQAKERIALPLLAGSLWTANWLVHASGLLMTSIDCT